MEEEIWRHNGYFCQTPGVCLPDPCLSLEQKDGMQEAQVEGKYGWGRKVTREEEGGQSGLLKALPPDRFGVAQICFWEWGW